MSDSIGKVYMDLETNTGPFQQQLNGIAGKSTNMVKSAFLGIGKVMAGVFAVKTLVNFGKASINLASDLAEVQNVVDVVFGESSSQINNFAKNALNSYGLSELSAKRYASTMGAMLKSMGLSEQAVLSMSQSITGLTGDMASFYNLDSEEAFAKIRAGISGETEPLKQLGINMSVANMEAYAMSQGITKAYQSMTQSEQALLRYNYLISTTSDAQGDFARTTDSWANQTRILTEQFNSLKATLGSAFIAVLTPVVKVLNWIISKLQIAAAYFKAFVEALTGVKSESSNVSAGMTDIGNNAIEAGDAATAAANKAKGSLAGFDKLNVLSSSSGGGSGGSGGSGGASVDLGIPSMEELGVTIPEPDVSGVINAANKVKEIFNTLKTFIRNGAKSAFSYFTTSFAPSIQAWGNAFSGLQEPVVNAFLGVGETLTGFWQTSLLPFAGYLAEEFAPSVANTFSETIAPIFTDVMAFALEQFALDFDFVTQNIALGINDIIIPALDLLKDTFTDTCEVVKEEWNESGNTLLTKFGEFKDSIKEIWFNLYDTILKPVWDAIVGALRSLWENHLKDLWESIVGFVSSLAECVMTIWNNILAPIVNWIVDIVGPIIVNVVEAIIAIIEDVLGVISDVVGGVLDALGGLLDFITGVFSGDWEKAWQGICDFFGGIWDAIWGLIKGVINLIIDALNLLWSAIYSVVSGIVNAIGGIAGALGSLFGQDWSFSMPSKPPLIPKLAKGGIIDQPTLAMVGEAGKEAVVPLENTAFADSIANAILRVLTPLFANGVSSGKDDDTPKIIVLKVGEYELGRISVGAINKYHNVVGRVELEV